MATVPLAEFLATIGFSVDESAQRKFTDAITSMGKLVEGLGLGLASLAAGVVTAVADMANSAAQVQFLSETVGDSVKNINALDFAFSKVGVSARTINATLASVAQHLKDNPALKGLYGSEQFGGKGTPSEQLVHFLEQLKKAGPQARYIWDQYAEQFGISQDVINGYLRGGEGEIKKYLDEYNKVTSSLGFDANKFGEQSERFYKSLQSLYLRISTLWLGLAQKLIGPITDGMDGITNYLDQHGPEIEKEILKIAGYFIDFGQKAGAAIGDVVKFLNTLSPEQFQIIEAGIIAMGAAFMGPGFLKMAAIAELMKLLLDDYSEFKKTGHSDLDFVWKNIGPLIFDATKHVANFNKELHDAFGVSTGLLTIFESIGAIFLAKLAMKLPGMFASWVFSGVKSALTGMFDALVTELPLLAKGLGSALASLLPRVFWAALEILGAPATIGAYLGFTTGKTPIQSGADEQKELERLRALGPNQKGPTQAEQPGIINRMWKGFWDAIVPGAKAEELPDHIKNLNQSVYDLNETLTQHFMEMVSPENGGFGGGGGGGASGGGHGAAKINWNDPKVKQALNYFMSQGHSMIASIGIVSNLIAESNLDETVFNSTGHGGIAQWDKTRQKTFEQVMQKPFRGSSYEDQLAFTQWELSHSEKGAGDAVDSAKSVAAATNAINSLFERSETRGQFDKKRVSIGEGLMSGSPMLSNPSVYNNSSADKSIVMHNNQTNHIQGAGDADATVRTLNATKDRFWGDILRNNSPVLQ